MKTKNKLLTLSEYNSLRAKKRWQRVSKKARSIAMRKVALARWAKRKKLSTGNKI